MSLNKYMSSFQFLEHNVDELIVKNKIDYLKNDDIKIIQDINIKDVEIGAKDDCHIGKISLFLHFICKRKGNAKKAIIIKIQISGVFKAQISEEMDSDRFRHMLIANGTSTLYSISRSIISTTSSQCLAHGQVRIPMINVLKFLQDHSINEDDGK